jgi:hypothetical protein
MTYPQFDRRHLRIPPLAGRSNRVLIERDRVLPEDAPGELPAGTRRLMDECAERMKAARQAGRPVMITFGAHTIKNGLAPVLIRLMEQGWVTHLATNGAGIIHDWEFAFQGASSENVKANLERGEFGIWEESGFYLNLALLVGAYEGLGYGESVGQMIHREGLSIPTPAALGEEVREATHASAERQASTAQPVSAVAGQGCPTLERVAAAVDLLGMIRQFAIQPGWLSIPHRWKAFSAQAAAFRMEIPFTGHPMIGHDIIYTHPMNHGAAVGRTALRDFLTFAESVRHLQNGVYLSVGSAVMSPMIFEKSLSMAMNVELQEGRRIDRHFIAVVDLAESDWNWQQHGEPPMEHPAYYQRYCKTFSRMGGEMRYICADNRDFLLTLCRQLA